MIFSSTMSVVMAAKIHALLNGRFNVSHDDLRLVAPPALRHRVLLNFEAESRNVTPDTLIRQILQSVPENG
jgi:MoxR-like ATPase